MKCKKRIFSAAEFNPSRHSGLAPCAPVVIRVPQQRPIRIFISSPSDVRPERLKAEQIIARLDREFAYHFRVQPVLWEREPLVATAHFQDEMNIPAPHTTDIAVVILWSRLGVALPEDRFRGAVSGGLVTGTEWEFEDAYAAYRETGRPALLLYRKTISPIAELRDRKAIEERLAQLDLVEEFVGRWFRAESGSGYAAASHSFATATEFEEQLYQHLSELLERRAGARVEDVAIRWYSAPYRGLLSFELEQAPVFFGRTRARNELREVLARQVEHGTAFALVFGASGSGKSSLVKAGLLPDLRLAGMIGRVGLVRWAIMRPSDRDGALFATLAKAILEQQTALPELMASPWHEKVETLEALLREAPRQAARPIRQGLAAAAQKAALNATAEARLLLVIDQFEELFTHDGLSPAERVSFVEVLGALAQSGLVWVVATMRSDFFDRLEALPALAALSSDGRYLLLAPSLAELGQIIRGPAQEAGLRFEVDAARGVALDEVILQAIEQADGALPLLSFLLDQLWLRRSEHGLLTFAAYNALGGLEGAIGRRAEEVFQAQPTAVRAEFIQLMRELVRVEDGKPLARAAPLARFPEGSPLKALADAFLDPAARLLVADAASGEPQLRLAHVALLSHWPRARNQVVADARDLELRDRLQREAEQWRNAPRREKRGRLRPAGIALAEASTLLSRWGTTLPAEIRDFIAASRRAAIWRVVRLWGLVTGTPLAIALLALAVWAGRVWWGVHSVEAEMQFVPIPAGCFMRGQPRQRGRTTARRGARCTACA